MGENTYTVNGWIAEEQEWKEIGLCFSENDDE